MSRTRTPEGKRIVIGVRVSEAKAEAIDAARGTLSRSAWVEELIDEALSSKTIKGKAENQRIRESASCPPHPRGRVVKGFCYRCGRPAS